MQVIGVDIGATKVNVVRVDEHGQVRARSWQAHDAAAGDDPFTCAWRLLDEGVAAATAEQTTLGAIGVSVAGLVDARNGVLVDGGLLLVKNLPIVSQLAARHGVPVIVENDANATLVAALANHAPAAPESTSLLFALGTGIGGAIGIGHEVLRGSFGFGGELGHLPVSPPGGTRCVCGSTGCLELVASGSGIARRASEAARDGTADGLLAASGKAWHELTAVDVVLAADAGDAVAIDLLETAGTAIGRAIAGLGAALDPSVIFISGSFGHAAAHHIIPAIERRLPEQHPYPDSRPLPEIRLDGTGPDAAAMGAAILAGRYLRQSNDAGQPPCVSTKRKGHE
jgi:glucokinase